MSQDGNASGLQYQFHSLHRGNLFPGDITGAVVADISFKGFRHTFGIAMTQHIFCIMSPCDDGIGEFCQQILIRDRNSCLGKQTAHFPVPVDPGVHKFFQLPPEGVFVVIDKQSQNMDIPPLVFRGKFDAGYDFGNRRGCGRGILGICGASLTGTACGICVPAGR